ncbi:MAG: T9SS type A sorting domain-containing protein [Bacteroidia bacterium]|nr:T9SS type A sorting domain-containing protein [Bacteroidia bacterium]
MKKTTIKNTMVLNSSSRLLKQVFCFLFVISSVLSKAQPAQYLTWDGGTGTSKLYWSGKLGLLWKNPDVGDWLDSNLTAQGSKPFATAPINAIGPVTANVTSLVNRWVSTGINRGFLLHTGTTEYPFTFDGRTSATVANRPQLNIVTTTGTFNVPCIANSNWSPSVTDGWDSRPSFQVSKSNNFSIVQFDLKGVTGTVQRATLKLTCTDFTYTGFLYLFEADPPTFREGGGGQAPLMGIAQNYTFDKNLSTHPSVLYAHDFSNVKNTFGWGGSTTSVGSDTIYDPATQSTYFSGKINKGTHDGCSFKIPVMKGKADGIPEKVETELYGRVYVYLDTNWASTAGTASKFPGFSSQMGWWNPVGYWQSVTGNGGDYSDGKKYWNSVANRPEYHGCSQRGQMGVYYAGDGSPYDPFFVNTSYMYHIDQPTNYGESFLWSPVIFGRGKWYCVEQYIKLNSISSPYDSLGNGTANYDGIYKAWIDGVPAFEKRDFRWRCHPEMGVDAFWLAFYHGGVEVATQDMNFRMNHVVVAREYIGPMGTTVTGIDNNKTQRNSLAVYPNPANNFVIIETGEQNVTTGSLTVFNALGQEVYNQNNLLKNQTKIETSHFPAGVYFVKVISNNSTRTGRFVVE